VLKNILCDVGLNVNENSIIMSHLFLLTTRLILQILMVEAINIEYGNIEDCNIEFDVK